MKKKKPASKKKYYNPSLAQKLTDIVVRALEDLSRR